LLLTNINGVGRKMDFGKGKGRAQGRKRGRGRAVAPKNLYTPCFRCTTPKYFEIILRNALILLQNLLERIWCLQRSARTHQERLQCYQNPVGRERGEKDERSREGTRKRRREGRKTGFD